MDWGELPSTFYRISVKVLIFDDQKRLLMGRASDGTWEPPGGGWEYDETLEDCLQRELQEELGVRLTTIGRPVVFYRGRNARGFHTIKIAVEGVLESFDFKFTDLKDARFVAKEELINLKMSTDEAGIKDCLDKIWP